MGMDNIAADLRLSAAVGDRLAGHPKPMTLTDFLLARIAEDEAVAREALVPQGGWARTDEGPPWFCDEQSDHVALAPRRLLAECEAKRRIVEESGSAYPVYDPDRRRIVMHLALPYADHPDCRDEWKPHA